MTRSGRATGILIVCAILLATGWAVGQPGSDANSPQTPGENDVEIAIREPVLDGVPVALFEATVHTADGSVDSSYSGPAALEGLRLEPPDSFEVRFAQGRLVLTSDLAANRRMLLEDPVVSIVLPDGRSGTVRVRQIPGWLSILPPLVAVVLAIALRNVYIAMLLAIVSGAVIAAGGDMVNGLLAVPQYLWQSVADFGHLKIMLFTTSLGCMIGVMAASGATYALVQRLTRFTTRREHGQLMTWLLGLVVFFDDYANTLLVGSTMRSVADRLRFSREKLAFLVDSTAAPVAGLALVSTWVGTEIGYIESAYQSLGVDSAAALQTFLLTIPYRVYPLLLLVFVGAIAYSGRDYGPMHQAELDAQQTAATSAGPATTPARGSDDRPAAGSEPGPMTSSRGLVRNAVLPIVSLLIMIVVGIWAYPDQSVAVLLYASLAASLIAFAAAVLTGSLDLLSGIQAWLRGAGSMGVGVSILVLAWAIALICDDRHLNTAGFIVETLGKSIPAAWLPTLAFLLSAVVSFATGSSFATMGLLVPLFVSINFYVLGVGVEVFPAQPELLGTIGAVLAGAIFGDHCSPISDTTVLSSAATGCDHLAHVATQFPYAVSVALVSLVTGYVPLGFGYSPWLCLPLGGLVTVGLVYGLGRRLTGTLDGEFGS